MYDEVVVLHLKAEETPPKRFCETRGEEPKAVYALSWCLSF